MATLAPVPKPAPDFPLPAAGISLYDYLHTSYKPDCDFIDDHTEERHVGERSHSEVQAEVYSVFRQQRTAWNVTPLIEQRIQTRPDRFRVCDLAILSASAPREEIILTPPVLCIEVLSPEDRLQPAQEVLEDYRLMGVRQSWLLDPIYQAAYTYDERGLQVVTGNRLELAGTHIVLLLDELFAALGRN